LVIFFDKKPNRIKNDRPYIGIAKLTFSSKYSHKDNIYTTSISKNAQPNNQPQKKKKKKKRMHDQAHTTPSSLTKNQPLSDQLFH